MDRPKEYRQLYLPLQLVDELDALNLTKPTRNKVLVVIYYALNQSGTILANQYGFEGYKPLSTSLLITLFDHRYHKIIKIIVDNDFLQRDNYVPNKKCYGYRLHPRFFGCLSTQRVKLNYKNKMEERIYKDTEHTELFKKNLTEIVLPKQALYDAMELHIAGLDIAQFVYDDGITWRYNMEMVYEMDADWNWKKLGKMEKWKALELSTQTKKVLVEMGGKITLIEIDRFIAQKAMYIRMNWGSDIENLCDMDCVNASRGAKGNRLFTNISNLPNQLTKVLKEHNAMEERDLTCAQPTLLNHKMQGIGLEGTDVEMFDKLTTSGNFYEFFDMPRKRAKQMIYEVIFGDGKETRQVQAFKSKFPTVWKFIEMYKEENGGYQSLSHLLQKMEAHLFIDCIYRRLTEMGIICFTKHDSIIYKSKDAQTVQEVVSDEVKIFGLNGQFEITRTLKLAA